MRKKKRANYHFFFITGGGPVDQVSSASWWQEDSIKADVGTPPDLFSSTHGLLQTHPSFDSGFVNSRPRTSSGGKKSSLGGLTFKHLDFRSSPTSELRLNPSLSSPSDCARACREGEPPKICYYHFTLEYYTVLGA